MRRLLHAWLPVALWMALLFGASTDLGAPRRTFRILVPLLRWFVPDISPAALDRAHFAVRKTGHVVAYAMLAALIWRAKRLERPADDPINFRRTAAFAFALAVLYAQPTSGIRPSPRPDKVRWPMWRSTRSARRWACSAFGCGAGGGDGERRWIKLKCRIARLPAA